MQIALSVIRNVRHAFDVGPGVPTVFVGTPRIAEESPAAAETATPARISVKTPAPIHVPEVARLAACVAKISSIFSASTKSRSLMPFTLCVTRSNVTRFHTLAHSGW